MTKHKDSASHHEADLAAFVARVLSSGLVWGIKSDQGWAMCPSNEYQDASVYPFWSMESAARIHCVDIWANSVPTAIKLDNFLDDWLPGMHQDDALVGPDWDDDLAGLEMEPMELAMALGADL